MDYEALGLKLFLFSLIVVVVVAVSCDGLSTNGTPVSASGVAATTVEVQTGADGLTIEQRNIQQRLELDNTPGSIKHLYIVSAYSGEVLLYSTVDGKVTSSGKRLTPYSVVAADGQYVDNQFHGVGVNIGGRTYRTTEVLQDDGTFGGSIPYLYWFDAQGRYFQYYITGGVIPIVSDQPITINPVTMRMDVTNTDD